ncbi:hypothetical protein BS47DRAFT_1396912 [Hydnum rufescens UP504]|uniref:Lysosomal dipeptide transporter MFSD1 n=1 Tax=Hydnum rufescens UP504 TaxID=1448309 RepID=A0A9P6AP99_9AGAM|nr:hypothetical protein BS47DRAFT_1396912 [Hydnum rufescens UP504]
MSSRILYLYDSSQTTGLGVSLGFGLVAGKGASFVAALTSYPLAQNHGPLAPFFVATMLAIFSFSINMLYLHASRWLASGSGVEPEVNEAPFSSTPITERGALEHVTGKKRVILNDIAKLVFTYDCAFPSPLWSRLETFPHIAANIIQLRYGYSESDAGKTASLLHAGGIVLFPICGFLVDRFRRDAIMYKLSMLASVLTFSCYIWFLLPPTWTKSALPGVLFFGAGLGFAPLLLVLIAPLVVPSAYVATAIGAHKSLESAGATISLTLAGIILDEKIFKHPPKKPLDPSPIPSLRELPSTKPSPQSAIERVLFVFAFLNLLHLVCIWFLWKLEISKRAPNGYQILSGDTALPYESGEREENHLDRDAEHRHHHRISNESIDAPLSHDPPADLIAGTSSIPTGLHGDGRFVVTEAEIARGRILFRISIALIVATWMFYSITLLMDLVERHGDD